MVIQKESGTTGLSVHQHGWADLPVSNGPNLVCQSMVHGWLIFSARPIMRCDGGRGKELLVSIGASVTRCQTESEREPSSRKFFSPPLGRLGAPYGWWMTSNPKVPIDYRHFRYRQLASNACLTHLVRGGSSLKVGRSIWAAKNRPPHQPPPTTRQPPLT